MSDAGDERNDVCLDSVSQRTHWLELTWADLAAAGLIWLAIGVALLPLAGSLAPALLHRGFHPEVVAGYCVTALALLAFPLWISRARLGRLDHPRELHCLTCGYLLKGSAGDSCPECGRATSRWQRDVIEGRPMRVLATPGPRDCLPVWILGLTPATYLAAAVMMWLPPLHLAWGLLTRGRDFDGVIVCVITLFIYGGAFIVHRRRRPRPSWPRQRHCPCCRRTMNEDDLRFCMHCVDDIERENRERRASGTKRDDNATAAWTGTADRSICMNAALHDERR